MWVGSDFNLHMDALELKKCVPGKKDYKMRYLSRSIPKTRKDTYIRLMEIKIKYSKMMENGDIPLPDLPE